MRFQYSKFVGNLVGRRRPCDVERGKRSTLLFHVNQNNRACFIDRFSGERVERNKTYNDNKSGENDPPPTTENCNIFPQSRHLRVVIILTIVPVKDLGIMGRIHMDIRFEKLLEFRERRPGEWAKWGLVRRHGTTVDVVNIEVLYD